jgi:hypothetical protein
MRFIPITLVLGVVLLLGCRASEEDLANGDDPIAALGATVESSRYGEKYWQEQIQADSDVWREAVAYCADSERANYPNCEVVNRVAFIGKPGPVENPFASEEGINP